MKNFLRAAALFVIASIGLSISPAKASQNSCIMPNTGTVSGLVLVNDITACANSILTMYSGGSPPGSPVTNMLWVDTSVTPNLVKQYDGANWQVWGALDAVSHIWTPPVGGGSSSITAAATTDLCANAPALQTIGGTTTITSFGTSCAIGIKKTIIFNAATPITYNATSMILPGQRSYTATVGDVAEAIYLGSGNWRVINVTRIDGTSVTNPAVPIGTMLQGMWSAAPAKFVLATGQALTRTSFPEYTAAVTLAQTVTSTAGNNTLTSVPSTQRLGAGMPIEGVGIPGGTTIASVTSNTIVMSGNASTSGTPVVTVFLTGYGASGNNTTVGVPKCNGRVLAGRDDMGGTAANSITQTWLGVSSNALNSMGGLQTQALSIANLAAHNHAVFLNDPGHTHTYSALQFTGALNISGGASANINGAGGTTGSSVTGITVRDTSGGGGTANQTATAGSGASFGILPPLLMVDCIMAVSP